MKRLTTGEAAKYLGITIQRVAKKIKQGHFGDVGWCECGKSQLIPFNKIEENKKRWKNN